jgi:hypothetical protein
MARHPKSRAATRRYRPPDWMTADDQASRVRRFVHEVRVSHGLRGEWLSRRDRKAWRELAPNATVLKPAHD